MEIEPAYYENGVPVFTPTYTEFFNFKLFVKSIEEYGFKAGLVKVIPPKQWTDLNVTSLDRINKYLITKPINQEFSCGGLPAGVQRQYNVETRKSYSIREWYRLCESDKFAPPILLDADKGQMVLQSIKRKKISADDELDDKIITAQDIMITPTFYNAEYLAHLERFYWRNVSFQTTMYGADRINKILTAVQGSLFANNPSNTWNISRLDNLMNRYPQPMPGVNLPYLYFGMYKATFAWHLEDMDLCSINYIHFGAPKQWYVIAPAHRGRFERYAKGIFFEEDKKCPEFLRHKSCVVSPSILHSQSIPTSKIVQHAGEFVLTFPGGYHQGYNTGFNCAESVNFACLIYFNHLVESWIEIGLKANFCTCENDSVRLDIASLIATPGAMLSDDLLRQYVSGGLATSAARGRSMCSTKFTPKEPEIILPDPKCELCIKGSSETYPLISLENNMFVHETCATHVLEPTVIEDPETNTLAVVGIEDIPKGRWQLKCQVCKIGPKLHGKFVGACIQCILGKCKMAYHVTCALDAGIPVELDDNGWLRTYCSSHDPRQEKKERKLLEMQATFNEIYVKGCEVIARNNGVFFYGVVSELQKKGCMIDFEDGQSPCFINFEELKPRISKRGIGSCNPSFDLRIATSTPL